MIDPRHALPIARQAELVGIARSTVYYLPQHAYDTVSEARAKITT